MAMDVGGAKGGIKSDINVTPLVDVMLVLLIIVMLVAPMLQKGVDVTLPEAINADARPDTADQTVVHIDARSQYHVNGIQLPQSEVVSRIQTALEQSADRTVYLKGDRNAPWGAVMSMMDALRENGIETVALITERPGSNLPAEGGQ